MSSLAQQESGSLSSVSLEEALIFSAPNGGPVNLSPGTYAIGVTEEGHLALVPVMGGRAFLLAAATGAHGQDVEEAVALLVAADDGAAHHLVLLLPEGELFEAVGSRGGVATRGVRRLSLSQLQNATADRLAVQRLEPQAQLQVQLQQSEVLTMSRPLGIAAQSPIDPTASPHLEVIDINLRPAVPYASARACTEVEVTIRNVGGDIPLADLSSVARGLSMEVSASPNYPLSWVMVRYGRPVDPLEKAGSIANFTFPLSYPPYTSAGQIGNLLYPLLGHALRIRAVMSCSLNPGQGTGLSASKEVVCSE
jgi:hypothetical protein